MALNNFTYNEYTDILTLLKKNRKNLTFTEWNELNIKLDNYFLLRHDIDYSLESALEMAKIEYKESIKATYFVLISTERYNLFLEESISILNKISSLGHEIGLHYDIKAMSKRSNNIFEELEWEIDILSKLSNSKVKSISMHNPSIYGDDPLYNNSTYINAYKINTEDDIMYYSDSCGAWRDNAYYSIINNKLPKKVQLLIHPIFWSNKKNDRWGRLDEYIIKQEYKLDILKKECYTNWNEHAGVIEHDIRTIIPQEKQTTFKKV